MTESINVYATGVGVLFEDNMVTLKGITVDNVVSEFPVKEVLDALEFSDIMDYVTERQAEDQE